MLFHFLSFVFLKYAQYPFYVQIKNMRIYLDVVFLCVNFAPDLQKAG